MKKIILSLLMGMFLMSLASAVVTYSVTPSPSSADTDTSKHGMKFNLSIAQQLSNITKHASSTATTCYVGTTGGGNDIGQGTFSGNVCAVDVELSADTNYFVTMDAGGGELYPNIRRRS